MPGDNKYYQIPEWVDYMRWIRLRSKIPELHQKLHHSKSKNPLIEPAHHQNLR